MGAEKGAFNQKERRIKLTEGKNCHYCFHQLLTNYINTSDTSTVILLTENFLIKMKKNNMPSTSNVVDNIKKMEAARAERRQKFEEQKQAKMNRDAENKACGRNVDVDFDILIG